MKDFSLRKTLLLTTLTLLINGLTLSAKDTPKREMRGVWVATVSNIDWPSKAGLNSMEQKKEVIKILTTAKQLGLNTIFLQVRAASDAIYASPFEPWSAALSGTCGKTPIPYYDPLEFWIQEAHDRGLELHAWINPYRASLNAEQILPHNHPATIHPEWFLRYGNKLYFNPALEASRKHIIAVTEDLLTRYNLDGIHMDDYFYPYPITGENFPDSADYNHYLSCNKPLSIEDWRRENVNQTIKELSETIKENHPTVAFGISPFGVWRNEKNDPRGSNSEAGVTNYDHLYADVLTWLKNDWIDYITPQLYWDTQHPKANYEILANWWNTNSYNKPLFIGHALYKVGEENSQWKSANQLPQQIKIARELDHVNGNVFYSYKHLNRDLLGFQDSLQHHYYQTKALPPHYFSTQGENIKIQNLKTKRREAKWDVTQKNDISSYIIYLYPATEEFSKSNPAYIYDLTGHQSVRFEKRKGQKKKIYYLRVAALNKYRTEGSISLPVKLRL